MGCCAGWSVFIAGDAVKSQHKQSQHKSMNDPLQEDFEAAYPLKKKFRQIVLPILLLLSVLVGVVLSIGSEY